MNKIYWVGFASLLLVSGIAFSNPSVRDWLDSAIPALGINGKVRGTQRVAVKPASLDESTAPMTGQSPPQSNSPFSDSNLPNLKNIDPSPAKALEPTPVSFQQLGGVGTNVPITNTVQQSNLPQVPASAGSLGTDSMFGSSKSAYSQESYVTSEGNLFVPVASLDFVRSIEVAAQADGIITGLHVDEGSTVKKDDPLVELDTRIADAEMEVQTNELNQARLKAEDQSNILYSEAAFAVAQQEVKISDLLMKERSEDRSTNERKKLEMKKAQLQINVSKMDHQKDVLAVGTSAAKLKMAQAQADLRKITANWDGFVSNKKKDQYEYVRAGEVIFTLNDMSRIRVKGVARANVAPHLLTNAKAKVLVTIFAGQKKAYSGVVGYVSPRTANSDGSYDIWVEIENERLPDGQYILRAGMLASIEIETARL